MKPVTPEETTGNRIITMPVGGGFRPREPQTSADESIWDLFDIDIQLFSIFRDNY